MLDAEVLAPYVGFTENEVRILAEQYGRDYEEVRRWYDGYYLRNEHLYNPQAVVNVMRWGTYQNDMVTSEDKDDVFTLLIHLGYLAYNKEKRMAFIPNEEIRSEFMRAIKRCKWNELNA